MYLLWNKNWSAIIIQLAFWEPGAIILEQLCQHQHRGQNALTPVQQP